MIRKAVIVVLTFAAVVTAGLWVVSHVAPQHWGVGSKRLKQICNLRYGGLYLYRLKGVRGNPWASGGEIRERYLRLPGLHVETCAFQAGGRSWRLWLDFRLPFILYAAYPTIAFVRGPVRRWRRGRKGHCLKCGYDLTGNVSGVCPECGEVTGA